MPCPHSLTVLGNACLDVSYHLEALPRPGETLIATRVTSDLGGKGLNQAIAAARAGASVRLIAPVGRDAIAMRIRALLQEEGIDDRFLIERDGPSDSCVILLDRQGENAIISDTGQIEALEMAEIPLEWLLSPDHLVLLQGNLSETTTKSVIAATKAAGVPVAINIAPMRAWLRSIGPVTIVIANQLEAQEWTGLKPAEDAQAILSAMSCDLAIMTRGALGCMLREGDGLAITIAAPQTPAVDTTGAGDVFAGVFLAEWLETGNAPRAAHLAVVAASDKVTRYGTVSAFPDAATIARHRAVLGPAFAP